MIYSPEESFYLLHRDIRRWLQQRGETAMHAGFLILPDDFGPERKARVLDIFAASGLPAANELYEWFPDRDWVRCP